MGFLHNTHVPVSNMHNQILFGSTRLQVTLSGLEHGLTPIAEACPYVHVFDRPALCLDALWLPYRRDPAELEACVRSSGPVKAIFGHADVVRACMGFVDALLWLAMAWRPKQGIMEGV